MLSAKKVGTALLALGLVGITSAKPISGQQMQFEYAVKLICGYPDRPALAPGRYFTAINIHNPSPSTNAYRRKFVLTSKSDVVVKPGAWGPMIKLPGDGGVEIDCSSRDLERQPFGKGFAVLQSLSELDIIAVYTAGGLRDSLTTMHTERVPARRVILK
jgi:hypothetical protein